MIVPGSANALMLGQSQGYNLTKSLRFRSSASAYLNRTPASSGSQTTFTWSAWVKRGTLGVRQPLFSSGASNSNAVDIYFTSSDTFTFEEYNVSTNYFNRTTQVFRDPSAWYHIVVAVDSTQATSSNRVKIYVNGTQVTSFSTALYPTQNFAYQINTASYPAKISQGTLYASEYFDGYQAEVNFIDGQALTPSSFGSTNATTGVWQPAKYTGTYGTNGFYLPFTDNSSATPTGLGKDYSGTSSNIIVGSATNASTTLTVVSTTGISVGSIVTGTGIPSNTYVTSIGVLQVTLSQAATSTTASTNYTFSGNNWLCNNISLTAGTTYDSMTDVPTLTSATTANYSVLNPINLYSGTSCANGNLQGTTVTGNECGIYGTLAVSSGKWYFEATPSSITSGGCMIGIAPSTTQGSAGSPGLSVSAGYGYYTTGNTYHGGGTAYGSSYTTNDVIGVALDLDNGKIYWSKNGTWQNSGNPATQTNPAYTGISGTFVAGIGNGGAGSYSTVNLNFGQQGFTYTPPTGYVALNTYNLPTSTIVQGNKYMDATLWTGDNTNNRAITNTAGFKPDFVWIKDRSRANEHLLANSISGAGYFLQSQATDAEYYNATTVEAFNSNGFTVGNSINWYVNYPVGDAFVGWQWQAGQGTTSSNTNGSITSTVSVNASAGFSVVTYSGASTTSTVGHGLGVAPSMVIVKSRNTAGQDWQVYHTSLGQNQIIQLNANSAAQTYSNYWYNGMTSSVFGVNNYSGVNASGTNYVAYCWAEIAGFSKFGSYTGNGSSDGPFVYTGFRPSFVLIKSSSSAGTNWELVDYQRGYNGSIGVLLPNDSGAEFSGNYVNLLSNGFKLVTTSTAFNGSGSTYIYMAFAENPFKNALAR